MEEKIIYETNLKIQDWNIHEDGSFSMYFEEVFRGQNVKISIHSNEITKHNRPHVHAFCNDKEYQISIDDKIEELNDKCDKYCKFIIKLCFQKELQNFRKEWNNIKSNYTFIIDKDGNYQCP